MSKNNKIKIQCTEEQMELITTLMCKALNDNMDMLEHLGFNFELRDIPTISKAVFERTDSPQSKRWRAGHNEDYYYVQQMERYPVL